MKTKIAQTADSIKQELVTFLREIIAIPSMCGKEQAVVQRIKKEMEKNGYDKVWIDPLGNLFGMMGTGSRVIALDGHCDTVAAGDPDNWQCDPFKGDYRKNIIYGRGAADQKGGLAAAVYAGRVLKEIGIPENTSILVVASVLEEDFEGLSWKYILEKGNIIPEAVLLTEPSNMGIRIGQRGRMEIKVETRGISCHGSAPERGENAIYKIAPVIRDIDKLDKKLHNTSVLGKGTVAVTAIRSSAPSLCAVPDRAEIHLDRRLTQGETLETCIKEISNLKSVQSAEAAITVPEYSVKSYTGLVYPVKAFYPMWLMERTHPLVRCAERAYQDQFSLEPDVGVWAFSTNGVTTKGSFDIPTIGLGPGREEHAHTIDDQVNEKDLVKAVEFYTAVVFDWAANL